MNEPAERPQNTHRITSVLRMAALAIRWERTWRVLWAPLAVSVLFIGIALTDILPVLPDVLHASILAFLAVLFGYVVTGLGDAFRPVEGAEAARRVETASGLKHRPLTALFDTPAQSKLSVRAQTLWHAHITRAIAETEHLTHPTPKPGVAAIDPWGLRFMPVLVLFVGVLMGGNDAWPRILRALDPIGIVSAAADIRLDMWITPPAYTGLAPSVYNGVARTQASADGESTPSQARPQLIVPVGSALLIHATNAEAQPTLQLGSTTQALPRLGDAASSTYKLETVVDEKSIGADHLTIDVGGNEFATWPLVVATDSPPNIEFERAPSKRRETQLDVAYIASDDYGIKKLELLIRRPNGKAVPGGAAEILVEVPLPRKRRDIQATTARDFSAHPWAGLPVRVRLIAEDTAGQKTKTDTIEVVLPERIFNHPVARKLVEARKALNDPTAEVIKKVAEDIEQLSFYPSHFFDDAVAFLSIRIAYSRLNYAVDDYVPSTQRLLWEAALRIEDGEFALAEADLMRMQDDAMQALRDGKTGEELDRVMAELQDAMDRYMQALVERLQEMGMDKLPPMDGSEQMETQDIQQMLDQIKELAETGNRQTAEQKLAEMQQMLEQLRQNLKQQQSNPAMAQAKKMMDGMRSLTQDQQELLDRTFKESLQNGRAQLRRQQQQSGQQGEPGQQGQQPGNQSGQQGQNGTPSPAEQAALRKRLGELMMQMDEMFGQIPDNLGSAEQQMEQSGKNLGKGDLSDAARNQTQALQDLRDATGKMAEAMAKQFGPQMGLANGQRPSPGGPGNVDPFGRQNGQDEGQGKTAEDGGVEIPSRMELLRAREIIDELRKRSGERNRPQLELDYLNRLLDVF
ncbi:TIGR02302 family protein [Rhodospirillales bacterium]|nr:TIGR02302 family protein [Rhodospirillales bacterium]